MAEDLRFTLLGLPSVTRDGSVVAGFISSKAQALLYYLAVTGRPHSRESLATLFWGEMPETNARANLRVTLCNLRQLFPNYLLAERNTLAFNRAAPYWLDVDVFQTALHQLDLPLDRAAETATRAAVTLYLGEFLEGFNIDDAPEFEDWALLQREQLRQVALQALHMLTIHATEQGAYKPGIVSATRLLALDPWREEAHRQLMLLLALNGQRSAALAQYETCRSILAAELNIEPLEETTELYKRIQAGSLDAQAAEQRQILPLPFTGRGGEHAWLVRQWKAAQTGSNIMALIEGEMGIGKTRLAEEMLHHARSEGAIILRARCYEFSNGVPYQPVAELLRAASVIALACPQALPQIWLPELARLLPELDPHRPSELDAPAASDETARLRLFEATTRMVLAVNDTVQQQGHSLIIFLDDLHWCDHATIDLLRYLVYRLHSSHVWFLGTYRPEDLARSHPLRMLRHMLGREDRVALLQLGPLREKMIMQMARGLVGTSEQPAQQLADALAQQSGGNPFIMSQLAQAFAARGLLRLIGNRWEIAGDWAAASAHSEERQLDVPFCVREMVLERMERLKPAAQRLLQLAAIAMPRLDAGLLDLLAEDRDTADESLTSCLESRLLVCPQPGTYHFALDLIRQVVYSSTPLSLRQQFRHKVARAYERHESARQKLHHSVSYRTTLSAQAQPPV